MDLILQTVHRAIKKPNSSQRPGVCLTWAQSLDGKLGILSHTPLVLSGPNSMQMTHALRLLHDSILVGVGTVLSDDPRLTCRIESETRQIVEHLGFIHRNATCRDPVPVILDTSGRTPPSARCLEARSCHQFPLPFLFCSSSITHDLQLSPLRKLTDPVHIQMTTDSADSPVKLDLHQVLQELHRRGVGEVMVEGGPSVLSSFLESNLWDVVVITISPRILGHGVAINAADITDRIGLANFSNPLWIPLGRDIIFIGFPEAR